MSKKHLDYNGLDYLCQKIKTWVRNENFITSNITPNIIPLFEQIGKFKMKTISIYSNGQYKDSFYFEYLAESSQNISFKYYMIKPNTKYKIKLDKAISSMFYVETFDNSLLEKLKSGTENIQPSSVDSNGNDKAKTEFDVISSQSDGFLIIYFGNSSDSQRIQLYEISSDLQSHFDSKQDKASTYLYKDDAGTNGTVSLSKALADGNRLRITYYNSLSNDFKQIEISYKSGRNVILDEVVRADDTAFYLYEKSIKLNSNSITVNHEQRLTVWENNTLLPDVNQTTQIYITEVELV